MSGRLEGKNIVVTAAGQGIGKATAIAFCNEGANVFATDINQETLNILKKDNPKIDVFKLDSTNKISVENYFKHMKQIDVLFNAVGFVHHGTILECEEKDWDFSCNVNIKYQILYISYGFFPTITATLHLTALALAQDYRRHLTYSSPPPHAHDM